MSEVVDVGFACVLRLYLWNDLVIAVNSVVDELFLPHGFSVDTYWVSMVFHINWLELDESFDVFEDFNKLKMNIDKIIEYLIHRDMFATWNSQIIHNFPY